jgi:transposase-like protein
MIARVLGAHTPVHRSVLERRIETYEMVGMAGPDVPREGWRTGKREGSIPESAAAEDTNDVHPRVKVQTVRLATEQWRSFGEAGRDPDIGESTLRSRKRAVATGEGQPFPGRGNPPALDEELRLRAEVKRPARERDILTKARASCARKS